MGFFKKNVTLLWGILVSALFLIFALLHVNFINNFELKFYDTRMKLNRYEKKAEKIVIVDIDDYSIERLGRWPWPRSVIAKTINKINLGKPKVIGLGFIYSEYEESSGLKLLKDLESFLPQKLPANNPSNSDIRSLYKAIKKARYKLNNDQKLEKAIKKSNKVILPVILKNSAFNDNKKQINNKKLIAESLVKKNNFYKGKTYKANDIILPVDMFLNASQGIGHINLYEDHDKIIRREALIIEYNGLYILSFNLRIAAAYLNILPKEIIIEPGKSVKLGSIVIPTTDKTEILSVFKGPKDSFKHYSFFDIINDKIPTRIFKNKIVIFSTSASGIMNFIGTPIDKSMSAGEFSANIVSSIINKKFIRLTSWQKYAEIISILIIGIIIILLMPKLKAFWAGATFLFLTTGLIGTGIYFFVYKGLWVPVIFPLMQVSVGYIGIISINFFITETKKEKVEVESAETNRMLGLSFQNQGMLDLAYDKYLRVPVNKELKEVLYNLGLDYERKRQYNKAAAVYGYIQQYDKKYKDISEKKKKLLKASENIMYGQKSNGSVSDRLIDESAEKPTLGRYEIKKIIGKGAMGVVYFGKDPTINRTTAIKTFQFEDDLDPDEIKKMKEKFFREAESAGTLSHPNIVTIYDAGEDQDIAYIAMEFLDGENLYKYTKQNNLFPIRKTVGIISNIADGLAYAHKKGIVHRDIKPANIMMLKTGEIKITDFGIAKITATSQTKTGIVKGTPYYMSPEQISGTKVDGRSDIFSLGVMLYQLLTGKVPFKGENPAALMHQIMKIKQPDPRKFNPKIMKPLVLIIDKALEKNPDKRYKDAIDLSRHLQLMAKKIDSINSRKML